MLIKRIEPGLAVNRNQLVVVAYVDQQGPTRVSCTSQLYNYKGDPSVHLKQLCWLA